MEFHLGSAIIASVVLAATITYAFRGITNVFIHPLSRYPGPWWMAASDFPRLVMLVRGRYMTIAYHLHQRYGPVVRVGPKELSYIDPQAWKDIYGHNKVELPKDPFFFGQLPNGVPHIGTASREDHSRLRSVFAHAFSDRALRQQEPLLAMHARNMVVQMRERSSAHGQDKPVVNAFDMYNFAAFDITSHLAFGESLQLLQNGDYTPWARALLDGFTYMGLRNALDKMPVIGRVLHLVTASTLRRQFEAHFRYACDMVDRRLGRGHEDTTPDIWTFVLRHSQREKGLSLDEMHSNAAGVMLAGGDTTSTAMSGLTYLLLKNPHAMARVKAEVREKLLKVGNHVSWASLSGLNYLDSCINETLRLYPPAAVGLPRVVPPGHTTMICGNPVGEGTIVYVSQYAAHLSESNFHRPTEFLPERWLGTDPAFANDRRDAYYPFSMGPRNCIGKHLAKHQIRLLICSALLNFDFELCPESEGWMERQLVWLTWRKPALWVKLRPVSDQIITIDA